jgi:hypothetical protein
MLVAARAVATAQPYSRTGLRGSRSNAGTLLDARLQNAMGDCASFTPRRQGLIIPRLKHPHGAASKAVRL